MSQQSKKASSEDKIAFARYQVYKKRLEAILKQKNPKKLSAVDALLAKYRGREHGVYAKVCQKYGITPKAEWTPPNDTAPKTGTSKSNSTKSSPSKSNDTDAMKEKLKKMKKQMALKKTSQRSTKPKSAPKSKPNLNSNLNRNSNLNAKSKPKSQDNSMQNKLAALKNKRLSPNTNKIRQPQPPKKIIKPIPSRKVINRKVIVQKVEESEDEYEDDFEVPSISYR